MLPHVPPNVTRFGTYPIDLTCQHLGCCRDKLRSLTNEGKIRKDHLDDDTETTIYTAKEILRFWFNTTKQTKTDGELDEILFSLQEKGYVDTFGCDPPVLKEKRQRKKKKPKATSDDAETL